MSGGLDVSVVFVATKWGVREGRRTGSVNGAAGPDRRVKVELYGRHLRWYREAQLFATRAEAAGSRERMGAAR